MKKPRLDITDEVLEEILENHTVKEATEILGCSENLLVQMRAGFRTAIWKKPKKLNKKCICGNPVMKGNYYLCWHCYTGEGRSPLDEDCLYMT